MGLFIKLVLFLSLVNSIYSAGYNPLVQERIEVVESALPQNHIVDNSFSNEDILNIFFNLSDGDSIEFDNSFSGEFIFPEDGIVIDKNIEIYGINKNINFKPANDRKIMFIVLREGNLKLSDLNISQFSTDTILIENSGTVTLENIEVSEINSSDSLIENYGTLNINYSVFRENHLTNYYGNIKNREDLNINGTTFYNNSSLGDGGAIYSSGKVEILNSTFGENRADKGGAIYVEMGSLKISFSTIAFNTSNDGGGVFNVLGTVSAKNSIFSNNMATYEDSQCSGEINSLGNNIFSTTNDCQINFVETDLKNIDPRLISYELYEGNSGVYVVNHQSVAYGLGDNLDSNEQGLGVDQTGKIYDERSTVGAYEYNGESYICNEEVTDETSGTILIEDEGFISKVRVSAINISTGRTICYQDLYAGESKLLPYKLGVNKSVAHEIIFENLDKRVDDLQKSLKTTENSNTTKEYEEIEKFDESLFFRIGDSYLIG